MLVSSFNLSQSFNYTPDLFYKKRFKSDIHSFCILTQEGPLKGQYRELVFSLIPSYLGYKERILNFFHVVQILTGLGQDFNHSAHKEKTHSKIFLLGRLKIFIAFCSLTKIKSRKNKKKLNPYPISWIHLYHRERICFINS